MKTFVYFRKYSHYDAKFVAAKFVEECEIRIRIRINFKNAKIRKHSFRIQKAKFAHAWNFLIRKYSGLPRVTANWDVICPRAVHSVGATKYRLKVKLKLCADQIHWH